MGPANISLKYRIFLIRCLCEDWKRAAAKGSESKTSFARPAQEFPFSESVKKSGVKPRGCGYNSKWCAPDAPESLYTVSYVAGTHPRPFDALDLAALVHWRDQILLADDAEGECLHACKAVHYIEPQDRLGPSIMGGGKDSGQKSRGRLYSCQCNL